MKATYFLPVDQIGTFSRANETDTNCRTKNIPELKIVDYAATLASSIDVGQGINVGPGKFGKKNKCRALNTHFLCTYLVNNHVNNLYVLSI